MTKLNKIPRLGDAYGEVMLLQKSLNTHGANPPLKIDGVFGPKTANALSEIQKKNGLPGSGVIGPKTLALLGFELKEVEDSEPVVLPVGDLNPAYVEAKKHLGKKETDSAFNKFLSQFWGKVGLPGYKTIIGTSFAWCGLFIAAMNSEVGQSWIKNGAGARNWAKYGQEINWKVDGIPESAVVHINHTSCSSGSGNHVTFAGGSCTSDYLKQSGAVMPGLGGNQGNTVKVSFYPAKSICAVRWPSELPKPLAVKQNVNCGSGKSSKESTR